ncbi:MAG: chemotaxis protein CheR [Deltaproteobacteria bacterium CG_4_9_14_3_um_filter_63_12]|nr:MAG: chemotaxis protein CheR [Deltaproteobacteria bacterium CG_4_9_14_3_um_filter_63_12]
MTGAVDTESELEATEIKLLLEGIFQRYGYDFRDYSAGSIRRRILVAVKAEDARSVSGLQDRVLHEPACMERLLRVLMVHVTSMFRDPGFYIAFRQKVVPLLATYSFVRIWHAGCSSGEEVYSLAILLEEEGIRDRCRIYATDLSEDILRKAKEGVFPLKSMKEYTENYQRAGGKGAFSKYYTAKYDHAKFDASLGESIVFAQHNLATDGSFNEFNVILCRNVMIYFNKSLQYRVHGLLHQSLAYLGVLGIGRGESLRFTPHEFAYGVLDEHERLYRRVT